MNEILNYFLTLIAQNSSENFYFILFIIFFMVKKTSVSNSTPCNDKRFLGENFNDIILVSLFVSYLALSRYM